MMKEVEVKYALKNSRQVVRQLNKLSKPLKINEFQKDTYFKLNSKLLRIRESKSGNFLSFKKRISKNTCNNHCTKIENAEKMKKILLNIGFKKIKIVEKTRSTWEYKNLEIAVDKVKRRGDFIEVESNKKENFSQVLKKFGAKVGSQDSKGYAQ